MNNLVADLNNLATDVNNLVADENNLATNVNNPAADQQISWLLVEQAEGSEPRGRHADSSE